MGLADLRAIKRFFNSLAGLINVEGKALRWGSVGRLGLLVVGFSLAGRRRSVV